LRWFEKMSTTLSLETKLWWREEEYFEIGIKKTIKWHLENEWWWGPLRRIT
jgi:dTDP-glucose 4,6-dehydratase